ncbi:MAG: hypothetical protein JWM85_3415 [Acidimicrobiaceae bacterium]|nr:hypothetical protein [Acidimicrobiaceae bacterium]
MSVLAPRDSPSSSRRVHPLHGTERTWTETNCYVDVWIEVLHSLGLEPLAACAVTLSGDFDGEQWSFFKFPAEDLRRLFGIDVAEMNVWRPVIDHVESELERGRLTTVEVDSFFLPDTEGVAYRRDHTKSTIVPAWIDREGRQLGYFHSAGFFELDGEDFDELFHLNGADPRVLVPYMEIVRLDAMRHDGIETLLSGVQDLVREHLARRSADNPVERLGIGVHEQLAVLVGRDFDEFHRWAFGTCRQCGAAAEIAAAFVSWLAELDPSSPDVSTQLLAVAEGAKALEFGLARAVRGRSFDSGPVLDKMASAWREAIEELARRYGA